MSIFANDKFALLKKLLLSLYCYLLIIVAFLCTPSYCIAHPPVDTIVKKTIFQPNAKRAGLYSAILPGLGQLYNRQYWKIPVIYAGLAVAGYYIADNLNNYQSYRKAYIGRINNHYPTDKYLNIYTSDQLQQIQNEYNKFLNLSVMFTGVGYTLQILEAMTGAHLKNFDISRDISMNWHPAMFPKAVGMTVVVNF